MIVASEYYVDAIYGEFVRLLVERDGDETEIYLSREDLAERFPEIDFGGENLFEGRCWLSSDDETSSPEKFTPGGSSLVEETTSDRLYEIQRLQQEIFGENNNE